MALPQFGKIQIKDLCYGKFIDIIDLKFNYAPNDDASNILNGINLKIKKGEFLTILGHNGSGKSTLAKHLNALLLPSFGKVFVKGIDTKMSQKLMM